MVVAAGCTHGTFTVTPPHPSGQVQQLCDHLGNQLPATLGSLHSKVVNPRSPLTHAWGSPPVVLRCGVPAPKGYDASSAATTAIDGVRWYQVVGAGAVVWTAIRPGPLAHHSVFVQLAVPTKFPAADAYLVALATPIKAALP